MTTVGWQFTKRIIIVIVTIGERVCFCLALSEKQQIPMTIIIMINMLIQSIQA